MLQLTAANPADVTIVLERDDGSGVVEVPILSAGTLSIGEARIDVTEAVLSEMVANFGNYPGPVPVSPSPHVEYSERSGPQPGFVDRLMAKGGQLWARMDLTTGLFQSVKRREWRGFSVEMIRNLKHPSRKFDGWVLVGGVFTNRPASDVVFKVAAESVVDETGTVFVPLSGLEGPSKKEVLPMSEPKVVGLEVHEAKVTELNAAVANEKQRSEAFSARITSLEADLKNQSAKVTDLEAKLSEVQNEAIVARSKATTAEAQVKTLQTEKRALETRLTESESKVKESARITLAAEVRSEIKDAIDAGVPPALFDGAEPDPAAWLEANYANFEAFKQSNARVRTVAKVGLKSEPVKSGSDSRAELVNRTDNALSAEERATLEAKGVKVTPEFIGVSTGDEARKVYAALKAAK